MWYKIPINICANTEITRKSNIIENYLNLIDISSSIDKESFRKYYRILKNELKIKNYEPKEFKEFHELILIKGQNRGYWKIIEIIKTTIIKNLWNFKNFKPLTSYSDIGISKDEKEIIKNFCDYIWKRIYTEEDKKEYVKIFIEEISPNKKCMCCGITSLSDGEYNTVRSDIDHFFPKSKYPFLSFYKYNLFVICSNCNKKKSDKIMVDYIINPYLGIDFKLILNSFSILDNEFNIKFEPNFTKHIEKWNYLFNIECLLKKEFKEKIEDYEATYKYHTLEALKELLDKSKFRKEITEIAYLGYKIKNYDRTKYIYGESFINFM